MIRRFLDHPSADVVAAAIEALAQLQDPEAVADLERFVGDQRVVTIEDFEDETKTTLGELAEDALEMLGVRRAATTRGSRVSSARVACPPLREPGLSRRA